MSQGTCFIIQPFSEPYNKRFQDVYSPAVKAADLEPYRIDLDPSVDHIVEKIQIGLRDSVICLADITLDNANVFYELGVAHTLGRDVVMVCDKNQRTTKLPFDVAHRTVLFFSPDSASDFSKLASDITTKLKAMLKQRGDIRQLSTMPLTELDGLEPMELTLLVLLAEETEPLTFYFLTQSMEQAGYTKVASRLALTSLLRQKLAHSNKYTNQYDEYEGHNITADGLTWLRKNLNKIKLRRDVPIAPHSSRYQAATDESPF
jgi:hypothetical protein